MQPESTFALVAISIGAAVILTVATFVQMRRAEYTRRVIRKPFPTFF